MKNICWSLVLSLCSLAISVIMIVIYIFKANEFSYADPVTYLSAVLGMIALFVAVGLGYQIYNAVDLKSQINDVKRDVKNDICEMKDSIDKTKNSIEILRLQTNAELTYGLGGQLISKNAYFLGLNSFLHSISFYLDLYGIDRKKTYLEEIDSCINNATGCLYCIANVLDLNKGRYLSYHKYSTYNELEEVLDQNKKYHLLIIQNNFYPEITDQYNEFIKLRNFVFDSFKSGKAPSPEQIQEKFNSNYTINLC